MIFNYTIRRFSHLTSYKTHSFWVTKQHSKLKKTLHEPHLLLKRFWTSMK